MGNREMEDKIIAAIKTVYDPEIPVDVYELGLIYDVRIDDDGHAEVDMTLTSPSCPSAEEIPGEIEMKVKEVPGINSCKVVVTFDPPWDKDMMSDEAKLELGFM